MGDLSAEDKEQHWRLELADYAGADVAIELVEDY